MEPARGPETISPANRVAGKIQPGCKGGLPDGFSKVEWFSMAEIMVWFLSY
jgi:hypothetical protein